MTMLCDKLFNSGFVSVLINVVCKINKECKIFNAFGKCVFQIGINFSTLISYCHSQVFELFQIF
jgi:hypothetical protein